MVQVSLLKLATLGSAILTVQGSEDASNKNVVHREQQQQPAAKAMRVVEKKAARGTNNQRNLRFNIDSSSTSTSDMMVQNSNTFDTYDNVDHSTYDTYDDKPKETEKTYFDENYEYSVSKKICLTEDDCRA